MAAIDIGSAATDRSAVGGGGYTILLKNNPANASGIINTIEIWANTNMAGVRVGTFYLVSGTDYKCRDSVTIGNVTAGSKQTFTGLSIAVVVGDYLGFYNTTGLMEADGSGGAGQWYVGGEFIDPGDQTTYTSASGIEYSIYGAGTDSFPHFSYYPHILAH